MSKAGMQRNRGATPMSRLSSSRIASRQIVPAFPPRTSAPQKTPESFAPQKTPESFAPQKTRESFAPQKTPESFAPQKTPESFSPKRTSRSETSLSPKKTSRSETWSWPTEDPVKGGHGNISLCVRLRPGPEEQTCVKVMDAGTLSFSHPSAELDDVFYSCDHTFGPDATQEQVYNQAVTPICEGVLRGYNGAVIAYGQTGSGKTHTMIGSTREGGRGVAPQAVSDIFRELSKRQCWSVEVTVFEIYNEKVRDLLAPSVTIVDVHEVCDRNASTISFHCPDATRWKVTSPEEALIALSDGMKRRETARTDMNHHSSRSHLVFTLTVMQGDPDVGATICGRLHIVDLAGSERLKRSMASEYNGPSTPSSRTPLPRESPRPSPRDSPRDQRREAGEINKSLSQLALVIQRLTGPKTGGVNLVPYRDSMLTRLLAESFGGSSKTCLIITCSPVVKDREETRCSLEFGKRAKLVENKAEINLEVKHEVTPVMQALIQKEIAHLHRDKEEMLKEREIFVHERKNLQSQLEETRHLLSEAAADAAKKHERHVSDVQQLEAENEALRLRLEEAVRQSLAVVLREQGQLEHSKRQRAAALEAEGSQLSEEWQAKLRKSSSITETSHPFSPMRSSSARRHSTHSILDSTDCSTADASMEDSSDAEQLETPQSFDFRPWHGPSV